MTVPGLKHTVPLCVALMVVAMTLVVTNGAHSQAAPKYPVMEQIAQRVVQKYQTSTCAQLWQEKQTPPSGQQAEKMAKAVEQLRNNPEMRRAFFDRVSPTIVNKMFECGMIP